MCLNPMLSQDRMIDDQCLFVAFSGKRQVLGVGGLARGNGVVVDHSGATERLGERGALRDSRVDPEGIPKVHNRNRTGQV